MQHSLWETNMIIYEPITKLTPSPDEVIGKTMINKDGEYCGKVITVSNNNWFDTDSQLFGYDNWMGFSLYLKDYSAAVLDNFAPTFIKSQIIDFSPKNNICIVELV